MRVVDVRELRGDLERLQAVADWLTTEGLGGRPVWRATLYGRDDAEKLSDTVLVEYSDGTSSELKYKAAPPFVGWVARDPAEAHVVPSFFDALVPVAPPSGQARADVLDALATLVADKAKAVKV